MAVLLFAEVNNGELALDATAKAVTAAKALGDVTVLAAGGSAAAAGEAAAKIDGVSRVLVAEDASLGHRLAEPTAALIVSLVDGFEHIVAPATTDAKNVMPRVAALLDVMVISDATAVVDGNTFERPIYAGNANQIVRSSDAKKVITFRTSTFDAAGEGGSASVETVSAAADPGLSSWVVDTEGLTAAEVSDASKRLREQGNVTEHLALIERVDLRQGFLTVRLDKAMLADRFGCAADQVNPVELAIEAPFQMRRRGVELKLHLGDPPAEIDRTLVQNIMKGRSWLAMVIAGKTFSEIADIEGVSKRRAQDVTNLALLAPEVLDSIATGEQPDGLTTDYLIKTRFSAVWSEQRKQFAAL